MKNGQRVARSCTDLITNYASSMETAEADLEAKEAALAKVSALSADDSLNVDAYLQARWVTLEFDGLF